jgi:hypothetical protein
VSEQAENSLKLVFSSLLLGVPFDHLAGRAAPTRTGFCRNDRSPASTSLGEPTRAVGQDDYDVIVDDGFVIGRIFKATVSPAGKPWSWTLAYGHREDRTPTYGYEATREDAIQAFTQELVAEIIRGERGLVLHLRL